MATGKLSATKVAGKLETGRYGDGGGLYLHVDQANNKRWIYRFTIDAKTSERGLGSLNDVTLAQARALASEARKTAKSGVSPVKEAKSVRKARSEKPTFGEVAIDFIATHKSSWKSAKHAAQWTMTIETYCSPILNIPVDEITTADVLKVLEPIWTRIPETAGRVRSRIENVWDSAQALEYIDENRSNPARLKGKLDKLLPKRQKLTKGHHPALPYDKMAGFMADLQEREAVAARALEFIILTAARSGEARGALWSEIDVKARVWTIPKERMKASKPHRVPLTDRALEIIAEMKKIRTSNFVFPGGKDTKPLSDVAPEMLMRRMNIKYTDDGGAAVTTHGFRSTFRDWVKECTTYQREIAEAALAHIVGDKAEQAYSRGDALAKRREMMDAWSDYCTGKPARGRWKLG